MTQLNEDFLHTRVCELLEIDFPIVSAGMGFVARAELAAAVSNAGGLGVIGGAGFAPERLRFEIQKCRQLTDRPFGVDLILPIQITGEVLPPRPLSERPVQMTNDDYDDGHGEFAIQHGRRIPPEESMRIVVEEEPPVFVSGLGNPAPWVKDLHSRGCKVMSLVGTARAARRVVDAGADVVIAQGTEGGGHTGRVATSALVPAVGKASSRVPVLAAGGITTGEGLAAALSLGASGAWMGTRFVASEEAHGHANYKKKIVEADEDSTVITRCYSGKTLRTIKNLWTKDWESRPQDILPFPDQFRNSKHVYVLARRDGDTDWGSMPCGQGAASITDILPAGEIVRNVISEARQAVSTSILNR